MVDLTIAFVAVALLIAGFVFWAIGFGNSKATDRKPRKRRLPSTLGKIAAPAISTPPPVIDTAAKPRGFHWNDDGRFDFEVVGESHYQAELRKISAASRSGKIERLVASLVLDDCNEFDSSAVAVFIAGLPVGYLSRDDARSFRRRLAAKKLAGQTTTCDARIVGGGATQDGETLFFGVRLDMRPF